MKILTLFKMSKEDRTSKEIERLGKSLLRRQEDLIDKLESEKEKLDDKLSALQNLEPGKVNTDTWNKDYQNAKVELKMKEAELNVALDTLKELFSTDEKEA